MIKKIEDRKVTFSWRDYKDKNKTKLMTVEASEFIRRFLLHILPPKFVKIRHCGIMSNRNRNHKLLLCKKWLRYKMPQKDENTAKISTRELLLRLTGKDIEKCPYCESGKMNQKTKIYLQKWCPT